jgi:hypothetical protein
MVDQWAVAVTLSNGQTRLLSESAGTAEEAQSNLDAFIKNDDPYRGDWIGAEHTWIARAHVVEASIVPL